MATLALVCTLSVFNGFQDMVAGFFTAFDPELKITIREGKVFEPQGAAFQEVRSLPEIGVWTETLEENAMVQYKDRQAMAIIKGVEDNFEELTSIDSLLYGAGEFILHDSIVDYGVLGVELISELGTGLQFVDPLQVYAPKRNVRVNMANPSASFNRDYLFSPGVAFVFKPLGVTLASDAFQSTWGLFGIPEICYGRNRLFSLHTPMPAGRDSAPGAW